MRTGRGTVALTSRKEGKEEGGIFNHDGEHGPGRFEEEDNEFLFVLCAGKAAWAVGKSLQLCLELGEVVGLTVVGEQRPRSPHRWGESP